MARNVTEFVAPDDQGDPSRETTTVEQKLIDQLVKQARSKWLHLTKKVLESALEGEITDHLGYDNHDPAGKGGGNSRNGPRSKTMLTESGPVEAAPRSRPPSSASMAVMSLDPTGADRKRWTIRRKGAMNAFGLAFDGRLTVGQL